MRITTRASAMGPGSRDLDGNPILLHHRYEPYERN
jgi:hypothetical protein